MRTTIRIEIETKDDYPNLLLESGDNEETYGESQKIELEKLRAEYPLKLHQRIVDIIKNQDFEDHVMDRLDDTDVDGWEDFKDYGIKLTIKKVKNAKQKKKKKRSKKKKSKKPKSGDSAAMVVPPVVFTEKTDSDNDSDSDSSDSDGGDGL